MAEVATAFVSLIPVMPGAQKLIAKQVDGPSTSAGASSGKKFGGAFSSAAGASFKKLAGVAAAAFAGVKIFDFFKGSIAEASDLSESVNAVSVSYGKAAEDVLAIGKNSATSFGLSKAQFNGFAVQFQSFAKTIAGTKGNVADTFSELLGRATDFASVMNLDVNEAATLFQSGLAGETEPLRRFGIDLSAASVEAFALSSGLIKNKTELTEAMKVQARYGLLMDKTSKTQGDFKNTSGGLANQQRILAAQTKDLQASIGKGLLPVLTLGAKFLNDAVIPALRGTSGFVKSNATTFKVLGVTLAAAVLPYIIASTVAFIANAASVVTTTAAWLAYGLIVKSTALATQAYTAVQWLLNAALTANPIGLVIVGLTALGAAFYLLWTKSETFRTIVSGAFTAVKNAALFAFNWVKANWPLLLAIITGPIGLAVLAVTKNWGKIKSGASGAVDYVKAKFSGLMSFFKALPGKISGIFSGLWRGVAGSLKSALNSVLRLPLKIPKVNTHIPGVGTVGGQTLIPALAAGAKVTKPTLALIGEAGTEYVIPEKRMNGLESLGNLGVAGSGGQSAVVSSRWDADDMRMLAALVGEYVLAGASRVANGLDDQRDFKNATKSRVPGAYAGSMS